MHRASHKTIFRSEVATGCGGGSRQGGVIRVGAADGGARLSLDVPFVVSHPSESPHRVRLLLGFGLTVGVLGEVVVEEEVVFVLVVLLLAFAARAGDILLVVAIVVGKVDALMKRSSWKFLVWARAVFKNIQIFTFRV